jgi:predicted amidohydrolase
MSETILTPYAALALQTSCKAINHCNSRSEAQTEMLFSIERISRQIRASKAFIGAQVKLVVLPEYFLTGFPMGETITGWAEKAAIDMAGEIYDALSTAAQTNQVYLSGNVYEKDTHFPDLYFQTSFIIDPQGEVILRYRRLISMFAPTPHDVLDKYLDIYGADSLFPVAKTPLGNLACVASEEILYPEITRSLALRGAEVICHSSSEIGSPLMTPKNIAKLARAYENHLFVVSANSAGIANIDIPEFSTDGGSKIVDFHGHVLAEAAAGESMVANADIDIAALRHHRQRPSMFNILSRQRLELFRLTYNHQIYPPNTLLDANNNCLVPHRGHFLDTQRDVITAMQKRGIIE